MNGTKNEHCQYLYKEVARMEIAKNIIILLLTLIGIILIGYGAYLAWKPLGFIIAGLLVTGFALTLDQPFKGGGGNS